MSHPENQYPANDSTGMVTTLGGTRTAGLSNEDDAALRERLRSFDDVDPSTLRRIGAGFRDASDIAARITAGTLDPLGWPARRR